MPPMLVCRQGFVKSFRMLLSCAFVYLRNRLVHRKELDDKLGFDGRPVVATRFVRACPKGHVDDLDWRTYVHGSDDNCRRQLWLDERGTSGDLGDLVVRCECGKSRSLYEAV